MQNIDRLNLDGHLLATFVAVHEEQSVTRAGARLGISQSTLSHRLRRLRKILGDPLFVRAGRDISPTTRADSLIGPAREVLGLLDGLADNPAFSVRDLDDRFVVAATDFERTLFLLDAYKAMLRHAPKLRVDFVWERYDNSGPLRKGLFDFAISPIESNDEQDLRRRPLFRDHFLCFYDPAARVRPDTLERYLACRHVRIIFSDSDCSYVDSALSPMGITRDVAIDLPSASELPALLKGSDLVATAPSKLQASLLGGFGTCAVPFPIAPIQFKLFWHERTHLSPKHAWLRDQIAAFAASV